VHQENAAAIVSLLDGHEAVSHGPTTPVWPRIRATPWPRASSVASAR